MSNEKTIHRPLKQLGPWTLHETLGQGSMGKVKVASNKDQKMACKIIPKPLRESGTEYIIGPTSNLENIPLAVGSDRKHQDNTRILREIGLSLLLKHPNIVQLNHVMITKHHYYLFFDLVNGTQLLDFIISHGKLSEKLARKFMKQIVSAVEYCHANSIVHRDLKIENILVDKRGQIKLIDFGLANLYSSDGLLSTFCGSLYFAAPELLSAKKYVGPEVDIWSLGIILYVLVCGKVPFDDVNLPALHAKIKAGAVHYPTHLSTECRDLLKKMLALSPADRANILDVKLHSWFSKDGKKLSQNFCSPSSSIDIPFDLNVLRQLHIFGFGSESKCEKLLQNARRSTIYNNSPHPYHLKVEGTTPPIISLYCLVRDNMESLTRFDTKNDGNVKIRTAKSLDFQRFVKLQSTREIASAYPLVNPRAETELQKTKSSASKPSLTYIKTEEPKISRGKSLLRKIQQSILGVFRKKSIPQDDTPNRSSTDTKEPSFRLSRSFVRNISKSFKRSTSTLANTNEFEFKDQKISDSQTKFNNSETNVNGFSKLMSAESLAPRTGSASSISIFDKNLSSAVSRNTLPRSLNFHPIDSNERTDSGEIAKEDLGKTKSPRKRFSKMMRRISSSFTKPDQWTNISSADKRKSFASLRVKAAKATPLIHHSRSTTDTTLFPANNADDSNNDGYLEKVPLTSIFTVTNTSTKHPSVIRKQLYKLLRKMKAEGMIKFREDKKCIFIEVDSFFKPQVDSNPTLQLGVPKSPLRLTVSVVQIQWTKLYGIRFKKLSGESIQVPLSNHSIQNSAHIY